MKWYIKALVQNAVAMLPPRIGDPLYYRLQRAGGELKNPRFPMRFEAAADFAQILCEQHGGLAGKRVLEIGTGSGYQAAILSLLARRVYTVDRHKRLSQTATQLFAELGLTNIITLLRDGCFGLPDQAPFDKIIVTAAAEDPPGPLLAQLREGGIMVLPVGQSDAVQQLVKVVRTDTGFDYEELLPVRFVPLVEGLAQD